MMATCPVCGKGKLRRGKVREEMFGVDLGEYPTDVCDSCGESFVDQEAMKKIEARAKEMGLWASPRRCRLRNLGTPWSSGFPLNWHGSYVSKAAKTPLFVRKDGKKS
jgi:YgiT-type zinc finger domain-containing protein